LPLRIVSAMKPCSASSYSLRSEISTSVGILLCSWPIASKVWTGSSSTAPPDCGPMMFGHQRYLAKLSVSRESTAQTRAALRAHPLRLMPLAVLSHGLVAPGTYPPGWPGRAVEHLWSVLQNELAALEPGSDHVVATRSDHDIQASNPLVGEPSRFIDPLPQFRQFCCPSCGTLIENEIAVAEDPLLRDVELL